MRGDDRQPDSMFSYVSPEQRVPSDHPLRAIRQLVDAILAEMSREFDKLYLAVGRPSIPPEQLLRALLLQISTPSGASACSWSNSTTICSSAGSSAYTDEPVWVPTIFTRIASGS